MISLGDRPLERYEEFFPVHARSRNRHIGSAIVNDEIISPLDQSLRKYNPHSGLEIGHVDLRDRAGADFIRSLRSESRRVGDVQNPLRRIMCQ